MTVQLTLSLIEYMNYIKGEESSRVVVEGEEVLNAGHIILYGKTEHNFCTVKICAICLQTSALQSDPHQINGELEIVNGSAKIKAMFCSCRAGAGGQCKHISAFLILLTRKNLAELEEISKTQLKCAWSNNKNAIKDKYKAVPVRAMPCIREKITGYIFPEKESSVEYFVENLPNSAIAKHRKGRTAAEKLTAVPVQCENNPIVCHSAQSVIMMEIAGFICNFQSDCCEQMFHNILNEEVSEMVCIDQNSAAWHSARRFRITGSRCYEIFTYKGTDWNTKSRKYFWPKSFSNKYTRHGLKFEDAARNAFILKTGHVVQTCGMIISPQNKWLGFSPDGIILTNEKPTALLEIKCLFAGATLPIEEALKSCSFITKEGDNFMLKKKHKYYGQVQLGMSMLNLEKCYVFVYSSFNDSGIVIEVNFDYNFTKTMLQKIKHNYFSYMVHTLCEEENENKPV